MDESLRFIDAEWPTIQPAQKSTVFPDGYVISSHALIPYLLESTLEIEIDSSFPFWKANHPGNSTTNGLTYC
jgi:hypothetical protein